MKYVIDIPTEYYEAIRKCSVETYTADMLIIANGKPLDEVLNEIQTEIKKAVWEDAIVFETDELRIPRLEPDDVFEIIDKYKAEREDKE